MEIKEIKQNKKQYLPLLLLADEQEDMIDRYLERGTMYVLEDNGVKSLCVVTDEQNGILELKNIATEPAFQKKGYGKALLDYLEKRLADLEIRRKLLTDRREKSDFKTISLVGYTNTGKSTLLNALTDSSVYSADRLFATLDTTSRLLQIDGSKFILTDTVGFLHALPHNLIEAFKSTLESALHCDLALIVCDATADYQRQLDTTLSTLHELRFEKPYFIIMNKSENVEDHTLYPQESLFISAKTGQGLELLQQKILEFFRYNSSEVFLKIPYSALAAYGKLKKYAVEKNFSYTDDALYVKAIVENIYLELFRKFIV